MAGTVNQSTYLASEPGCAGKRFRCGDARRNEVPTCATAGSDKLRTAAARNHLCGCNQPEGTRKNIRQQERPNRAWLVSACTSFRVAVRCPATFVLLL